jgi:hypothetical protein
MEGLNYKEMFHRTWKKKAASLKYRLATSEAHYNQVFR